MSTEDDESEATPDAGEEAPEAEGDEPDGESAAGAADESEAEGELEAASLDDRLEAVADALSADEIDEDALSAAMDAAEGAIDLATTEADLDEVDGALDDVAEAIEAADLPEPADEDEEDPREALESRLDDVRAAAEAERGPYAADVLEEIEAGTARIEDAEWTEQGEGEIVEVVAAFVADVGQILDVDLDSADAPDGLPGSLDGAAEAIEAAALDPDADAETVAALVEAAASLADGLEEAQEWDDLSTREKLDAEGFYDVLEHRKDYPPEWGALKVWEQRGRADMVLLALERLEADFMENHCLEALARMGPEEALEPMLERAGRRDVPGIRILGKIGSAEAVDTIVEYVDTEGDPTLQKTTLKALGEIGSDEATQAVANQLVAENEPIRVAAARSLGMIGDPRAVEPLSAVLADDESDTVRGAAAWALNQIGTEAALDAAAAYADDRSYLVQAEAEKAAAAIGAAPA